MTEWQPRPYKHYKWIVADPELLGGALAIRDNRLSVSHILECLAVGMTTDDIEDSFGFVLTPEILAEILHVSAGCNVDRNGETNYAQ